MYEKFELRTSFVLSKTVVLAFSYFLIDQGFLQRVNILSPYYAVCTNWKVCRNVSLLYPTQTLLNHKIGDSRTFKFTGSKGLFSISFCSHLRFRTWGWRYRYWTSKSVCCCLATKAASNLLVLMIDATIHSIMSHLIAMWMHLGILIPLPAIWGETYFLLERLESFSMYEALYDWAEINL